jgi:acyl-CoA thioesterase-1
MTRRIILFLICSLTAAGQQTNPAFAPIKDVPGLPRVLIIGDSISIGYTPPLRKLLDGKVNVHRVPDNSGPTTHGIQFVEDWIGKEKWDVIHFNFGLHDLKLMWDGQSQVSLSDYERNLRRIVSRLKQTGAHLIWASITPVPDGNVNPPRSNADVLRYNEAAARVMKENGIPIDDLYSLINPRLAALQLKVNVHFTPEGYEVLAQQAAASIKEALAAKESDRH